MAGPAVRASGSPVARLVLAIDTSTRTSLVLVGRDEPEAVSRRAVRHRHGSHVLEQIDEALRSAAATLDDIAAVAVGTGPGSFTGLRVGLATAKTIAYARATPIVGIRSSDALRRAARLASAAAGEAATADLAIVLPAGAHDHYLARAGRDPVLVAPGGLVDELAGDRAVGIDVSPGLFGADAEAEALGHAALEMLPASLLAMAQERLARDESDDVAELVPAYVALPRGVVRAAEELGWSPDLR